MSSIKFNKEEVQKMIMEAFVKGENWAETYSGWFTPTEEEKAIRAAKDCEEIYKDALIAKFHSAMEWWNGLSSLRKTQLCDTNIELIGSVRRWETLTGREVQMIYEAQHFA